MPNASVEVEGLTPWLESGDLTAFVAAYARWADAAPDEVDARLSLRQWDIREVGSDDLPPSLTAEISWGPKGYRGSAKVVAWPGADPARFAATLDGAAAEARKAHLTRRAKGTTYCVESARFDMERDGRITSRPDGF